MDLNLLGYFGGFVEEPNDPVFHMSDSLQDGFAWTHVPKNHVMWDADKHYPVWGLLHEASGCLGIEFIYCSLG